MVMPQYVIEIQNNILLRFISIHHLSAIGEMAKYYNIIR